MPVAVLWGALWVALGMPAAAAVVDPPPREMSVDEAHAEIALAVDTVARQIDGLFDEEVDIVETRKSRLRLGAEVLLEPGETPEMGYSGSLRLVLPGAEERLSLVVDSEDEFDRDLQRRQEGASDRRAAAGVDDDDDELFADLRYELIRTVASDLDARIGVRLAGPAPTAFVAGRFRRQWQPVDYWIRTTHELRRFVDSGFEWQSQLTVRRPLADGLELGHRLKLTWQEDEAGIDYQAGTGIRKALGTDRSIEGGLTFYFSTEANNQLSDVVLSSTYRTTWLKPWFHPRLGPRLRFSETDDFDPVPGFVVGFDVMF